MQSLNKHNSFFGWLNSFRIMPTNMYFGRATARPLCPPIIPDPKLGQVIRNWNTADTGAFLTLYVLGLLLSKRISSKRPPGTYVQVLRSDYFMITNVTLMLATYVSLVNSANRLRGFVPNGLTWSHPEPQTLKKYDYTSELLKNNRILRWFVPFPL